MQKYFFKPAGDGEFDWQYEGYPGYAAFGKRRGTENIIPAVSILFLTGILPDG